MATEVSIWSGTLAEFRERVGGADPVPAGVSISAVSASLALALLAKVLRITGSRKDFAGDPQEIETLCEAARRESAALTSLADEDVQAFNTYLECIRMPDTAERDEAVTGAMREATRIPMEAARTTIRGLDLCAQSTGLCGEGMTAADLGMAESLLSGAVGAMLLSIESNLRHIVTDDLFCRETNAELLKLKTKLAR